VGLYGRLIGGAEGVRPGLWDAVESVGWSLLGLAGAGVALQAARRWLLERSGPESATLREPPPPRREDA
jgi:hypothetical protein